MLTSRLVGEFAQLVSVGLFAGLQESEFDFSNRFEALLLLRQTETTLLSAAVLVSPHCLSCVNGAFDERQELW